MEETIFIQIASYRDPELVPTLDDLLDKSTNPDNLHICIAFQYSEEDTFTKDLDKYRKDKRFNILDIPYKEATGACYARNLIQQQYNNETYTLQLDSHHRFVDGWDTICIDMLKDLQDKGYKKPLLTSYIPSYQPDNDPDGRVNTPWGMSFDRFTPEGVIFFLPYYMAKDITSPIPARYFSAHFAFTLGQHAIEVQHDPEYYFHGEEISLAVRSYTHGYDLFHPHKVIAFHEYTRVGRTKQWDDDPKWGDRNVACHKKMRSLLGVDGENEIKEETYGLGKHRTIEDYEIYAGIKFADRSITERAKQNKIPPGGPNEEYFGHFRHPFDMQPSQFPERDYTFCAIIFEDKLGNLIHRDDMTGNELNRHLESNTSGKPFTIWKSYQGRKPDQIVIWPHSESKGWGEKRIIKL